MSSNKSEPKIKAMDKEKKILDIYKDICSGSTECKKHEHDAENTAGGAYGGAVHTARKAGHVTLIGAGCGKGLITALGIEALKKAESIVYDDLIDEELLKLPECKEPRLIYAGKRSGRHSAMQEEINNILISEALAGRNTVRLKGGDSFVFGRGGEELMALEGAGIECSVISGVSSCIAVPESAGIPVTHRGLAQSFTVVTGHTAGTLSESYEALAGLKGTLVFLMGIKSIREITERLMECGKAADTPASVISRGCSEEALRIDGTLADIAKNASDAETPGVLVIGETAGLHLGAVGYNKQHEAHEKHIDEGIEIKRPFKETPHTDENDLYRGAAKYKHLLQSPAEKLLNPVNINSADKLIGNIGALNGIKAVVTGTKSFADRLSDMLIKRGAVCDSIPTIKITAQTEAIPEGLSEYGWIVFTSANGVRLFFDRFYDSDMDIRTLSAVKFACIGSGTAAELKRHGIKADFVPSEYTAECLGKELGMLISQAKRTGNVNNRVQEKVLILRAENGSELLTRELSEAGICFDDVHIYRAEPISFENVHAVKEKKIQEKYAYQQDPAYEELQYEGESAASEKDNTKEKSCNKIKSVAEKIYDYIIFGSAGGVRAWFKNIDVYGKINDAAARAKVYDKESSEAEGRSEEITYINLSCRGTLRYKKAVCIGKYTAVAYRELTGDDPIVAVEASADGVIEAIMKDHEWA